MRRVSAARRPSRARKRGSDRVVASPRLAEGSAKVVRGTPGARAAQTWFADRGLATDKPWFIEVALDVVQRPAMVTYSGELDTRFHLNVYPEEWGVYFCHDRRSSWVRVTDQPFVHGRDDHQLLDRLPTLAQIGRLLHELEKKHGIKFQRGHALVRTNVTGGKPLLRKWLSTL